ncbi:hypothetical protein RvY_15764 [Ramazzottius varieornatus]|uniref:MARVEL domain-containing protein n=1 Tax=Ramazzottius varieornatus TaxID=947166 RepID=A0A1D1W3W7_RAMVA|nr:hypothetical protein RvY_15764 [Ramazzottius varieornatus]
MDRPPQSVSTTVSQKGCCNGRSRSLFILCSIEVLLGVVLIVLSVVLLHLVPQRPIFFHVFGFVEGVVAVLAGVVGILESRKGSFKTSRPWLISHCSISAICVIVLALDTVTVTPSSIRVMVLADFKTTNLSSDQWGSHLLAILYMTVVVVHCTLLLALLMSFIVALVRAKPCSQKGRYETAAAYVEDYDPPEMERL